MAHCDGLCRGPEQLPFDRAELNPFAVTIRYDEPDEAIEPGFAREILKKPDRVLTVVMAALPEGIGPR